MSAGFKSQNNIFHLNVNKIMKDGRRGLNTVRIKRMESSIKLSLILITFLNEGSGEHFSPALSLFSLWSRLSGLSWISQRLQCYIVFHRFFTTWLFLLLTINSSVHIQVFELYKTALQQQSNTLTINTQV